jgi:hypothetical protein
MLAAAFIANHVALPRKGPLCIGAEKAWNPLNVSEYSSRCNAAQGNNPSFDPLPGYTPSEYDQSLSLSLRSLHYPQDMLSELQGPQSSLTDNIRLHPDAWQPRQLGSSGIDIAQITCC